MNTLSRSDRYLLNCFPIEFSADHINVAQAPWTPDTDFRSLQEQYKGDWFLLRRGDSILGMRVRPDAGKVFRPESMILQLDSYDGIDFVRARLADALPGLLPAYQPRRTRPFRFLAQKDEFVARFAKRHQLPELVQSGFAIRPRFDLEARTIELTDGALQVVLVMAVGMQWEIAANLTSLLSSHVPLEGLYIVRREHQPGERRLLGRIQQVRDGTVALDESMDGPISINADLVQLEGSKVNFKRCLEKLLDGQYRSFESAREAWEAGYTNGPSLIKILSDFANKPRSVVLGPGVAASVGGILSLRNTERNSVFRELPPVEYCFDPARTKRKTIPWDGLVEFGPYDSEIFEKRTPRILVVVPQSVQNKAEQVLATFADGVPESPYSVGFARLFNLRQIRFDTCPVPDHRLPMEKCATTYRAAIENHLAGGPSYDAAFVVIPDLTRQLPDAQNPYLHVKALLLTNGIPSQQLRISTLHKDDSSMHYTLRNIAVSLYAKMDGAPWTVSNPRTYNDEIVIGMGAAEVAGSRCEARQRHMGITTVFLGDGNFLLSNVSRECSYEEYPVVLQESTKAILTEVKRRNGWQPGDRVRIVFHCSKPLKNVEIDELLSECVSDVACDQTVEFASLHVAQDHPFKIIDQVQRGIRWGKSFKGTNVPPRGFLMQLGANTMLLATNGPVQVKRPLSPLPAPLLVHLHKRSTSKSLDAMAEQVLKFTSMTWRSTSPAAMPVTIYYSELIAELLARFRSVPDWSPALLNTKLRASRWFL